MTSLSVGIAASGKRVGEHHGKAKLSDSEVDLMRELYEGDKVKSRKERFWTMRRLKEKFEISLGQVYNIVSYSQRATSSEKFRRVHITD